MMDTALDDKTLLRALQSELQDLKHENNELKFLLFIGHKDFKDPRRAPGGELEVSLHDATKDFLENVCGVSELRKQLVATTALLEEATLVQEHYKIQLKDQENEIEDFKRRLKDYRKREISLMKQPTDICTSRSSYDSSDEFLPRRSKQSFGKLRSASTITSYRPNSITTSSQTLPENYKDAVATLPPIFRTQKPLASQEIYIHRVKKVT